MEIRPPATDADVRGLIEAHGRSWRAAYDEILPKSVLDAMTVDPTPAEVTAWTENLESRRDDPAATLVAVVDGAVRGFVDVRWGDENTKPFVGPAEAGIKAIYVHPDAWGEGIGTALLDAAIDGLPEATEAVRLEAFANNEVGARFYEARGFERSDAREVTVGGETYPAAVWVRRR